MRRHRSCDAASGPTWVLASAVQIKESVLFEVCVVTEDAVDRDRLSMVTACDRLKLR